MEGFGSISEKEMHPYHWKKNLHKIVRVEFYKHRHFTPLGDSRSTIVSELVLPFLRQYNNPCSVSPEEKLANI